MVSRPRTRTVGSGAGRNNHLRKVRRKRQSRSKATIMYKEFFGLKANPFNVNPDPRYLFLTRHTEEALACLTYGIQSRKGFVLLTGEVGTGKTTLINKLLEWLRLQQVATAFIFNSRRNVPQFLDYMMTDFGIPCDSKAKRQILLRLSGSDGQQIFDPEALVMIHRYASGIPRVVNLLCEHSMVSAFVDQQKVIVPAVVDAVARDLDLSDNTASGAMMTGPPPQTANPEKFDLVEALRSLATLADRLRDEEKDLPKERKL